MDQSKPSFIVLYVLPVPVCPLRINSNIVNIELNTYSSDRQKGAYSLGEYAAVIAGEKAVNAVYKAANPVVGTNVSSN